MKKDTVHGRKALQYITLLLTTAAILLTLLAISVIAGKMPQENDPGPAVDAVTEIDVPQSKTVSLPGNQSASHPSCYTILLSGNEIRLTSADAPGTYVVLDGIDPRTLREADRKVLETGLQLNSEEALIRFLEDFGS